MIVLVGAINRSFGEDMLVERGHGGQFATQNRGHPAQ